MPCFTSQVLRLTSVASDDAKHLLAEKARFSRILTSTDNKSGSVWAKHTDFLKDIQPPLPQTRSELTIRVRIMMIIIR